MKNYFLEWIVPVYSMEVMERRLGLDSGTGSLPVSAASYLWDLGHITVSAGLNLLICAMKMLHYISSEAPSYSKSMILWFSMSWTVSILIEIIISLVLITNDCIRTKVLPAFPTSSFRNLPHVGYSGSLWKAGLIMRGEIQICSKGKEILV